MFEIYDISVSVKLPLNRKLFIPPFCGISYYERLLEKCYNEANTDYEKFIFKRYRYILDCTKDCLDLHTEEDSNDIAWNIFLQVSRYHS